MPRPRGQARTLWEQNEIFRRREKTLIYMLYDPVSSELDIKIGLTEHSTKRFVGYNILYEGVRFLMICIIKNKHFIFQAERKAKEFANVRGNRITSNLAREALLWVEWFRMPNRLSVYDLQNDIIKWNTDNRYLVAAQKWRYPTTKLRITTFRGAKARTTLAHRNESGRLRTSQRVDRAGQGTNFAKAFPIFQTRDSAFLYIVRNGADTQGMEEKQDSDSDIDDEKNPEPRVVLKTRWKFGFSYNISERCMSYSVSLPRGVQAWCWIAVPDTYDLWSLEKKLKRWLLTQGAERSNDVPYRETETEFLAMDKDDMIQALRQFIDILDDKYALLKAQIFVNGAYADPRNPNLNGIINPRNRAVKRYTSRYGRRIQTVIQQQRGARQAMVNRELDSIFRTRDWLGEGTRRTEELRREAAEKALYQRAWGLIRNKFMRGRAYNEDIFYANEHKIREYLRIKNSIIMEFHEKEGVRMAKFRAMADYEDFPGARSIRQREADYQARLVQMTPMNPRLRHLTIRKRWTFYLWTPRRGRRKLFLSSVPRATLIRRNKLRGGDLDALESYPNSFYKKVRGEHGKRILADHPEIRTVSRILPDA